MPQPGYGQMRTSAADRERAVDVLKAGFAEGRLDKEEYVQRVGMVETSRTYAELAAIVGDLPVGPFGTMPYLAAGPQAFPAAPSRFPAYPSYRAPAGSPVYPPLSRRNGLAVASLVCACAAFMLPPLVIPAIMLGAVALGRPGPDGRRGRGMALAGMFISLTVVLGVTLLILR